MAASMNVVREKRNETLNAVYESIFATTEKKLTAIENSFVGKYKENLSRLEKYEDCKGLANNISNEIKTSVTTCQVIKGKTEQKVELSTALADAIKLKDRELHRLESLQETVAQQKTKLAEDVKVFEDEKMKKLEALAKVQKYLNLYKESLALEVKRDKDGLATFIFKNINQDDSDEAYKVALYIDSDDYTVSHCSPAIRDMDALLDELNVNNDLGCFICKIRKRFRIIANDNHPMP